ncbi:hypothetical protein NDU88_008097 [Pleurodeles waltl]|uniref:Uncharacterized protein n=1 Tax=Pleurodeles waltl TaxID=8319 RepID=A0AAV7VRK4_PLEWA|nr:hypothetical protein NDU88_008097 [Pleurodeles waltl]
MQRRGRGLKNPEDTGRKIKGGCRERREDRSVEPIRKTNEGRNNEEDKGGRSKTTTEVKTASGGEQLGALTWTSHPEE